MALFKKKPAASAPAPSGDSSTALDDFSDFSPDALEGASTPAADDSAGGKGRRGRAARGGEKKAAPKGLKPGAYIGLNIGSDSIKVVEIQAKGTELSITGMGMVPTPPDSISNGVVMSVNALAGAIKEALNQAGIKSKKVVTSVSGTGALVVRIIEVPKMSDGELEDNMKMDADRYIPFPPSEVIMDFKALRDLPTDPDAMNMEVLLAAAQREIIDLHIQVLQDAKLDPRAIDVEPLSAARALTHPLTTGNDINAEADYNDVAAILNIGASGTEISILRGDLLVFTRTVPTGGNTLTQALVDTLGLAWHDAEGLKREMGDALAPVAGSTAAAAAASAAPSFGADDFGAASTQADTQTDDWTEFGMDSTAAAEPLAADPNLAGASTPAAATDPFDDEFFNQGPQQQQQQQEPQEQQQQKVAEEPDSESKNLPTREGEIVAPEAIAGSESTADPAEAALLPSKGETEARDLSQPATAQTTTPAAQSTPAAAAPSPASPQEEEEELDLAALFKFDEVEEPDEELPTSEEQRLAGLSSLLGEEEDDLTDLPTLVSDAAPSAPLPSAFDFPAPLGDLSTSGADSSDADLPSRAGSPASTEGIAGAHEISDLEANLLPSESSEAAPTPPASFALADDIFGTPSTPAPGATAPASTEFSFDPLSTMESPTQPAPEPAVEPAAPAPAAPEAAAQTPSSSAPSALDDPFAAFDLSGAAPGAPSTPTAPTSAAAAPAGEISLEKSALAPAADDFDLDSLFGGEAATTPTAPGATGGMDDLSALDVLGDASTPGAPSDADLFGTDFGGTDFGDDLSSFGAGLGGAATDDIDAATLHAITQPVLENLIAEVRRSLEYHTTRYPDAAVRRITLIGGGAKLKNIDAYFTQNLGIPTAIGNPAARLPVRAPKLPPGYADENGPLFTVAIGLAMRELMR